MTVHATELLSMTVHATELLSMMVPTCFPFFASLPSSALLMEFKNERLVDVLERYLSFVVDIPV